jgi:hypothetical protein
MHLTSFFIIITGTTAVVVVVAEVDPTPRLLPLILSDVVLLATHSCK